MSGLTRTTDGTRGTIRRTCRSTKTAAEEPLRAEALTKTVYVDIYTGDKVGRRDGTRRVLYGRENHRRLGFVAAVVRCDGADDGRYAEFAEG